MRFVDLTAEAIEGALRDGRPVASRSGFVALVPESARDRVPLLQAAAARQGVALVGAIFPALLQGDRFVTDGAWLLGFDTMPPHFLLPALNAGDVPAGGRLLGAVRQHLAGLPPESGRPTLFMIFDSMVPNVSTILDDIYLALANRVEYAGVSAGSESFQPMPCLFDATRVVGDGVLGLLLPPAMTPLLAHGFVQPEQVMGATSTRGNRIATLDWRPAFTVYQELIKAQFGIDLTPENFYQYGVHYPFGLLRANGDVVVRIPVALEADGSLHCIGEIPENALLVLLQAPPAGGHACIGHLAKSLVAAHGPRAGRPLLTFYCAGRRLHLGDAARDELRQLAEATGATPLGGALSLGEIGNTVRGGYPMFHNATLVCAPWSPP
ncbi:MAG: FIST signal transduction protein [Azonexus sp.]